MQTSKIRLITFTILAVLVLVSALTAFAAANTVPSVRLTDQSSPATASDLAPPECDSIRHSLNSIVVCTGGNCNGTRANDLILGDSNTDNIKGKNGDDCIVGGGGNDDLTGNNGTDICVGGPGNDTFKQCETQIQ